MAAIHTLTALLDSIATVSVAAWLFRITALTILGCMYLALARQAQPALRHAVAVASLVAVALLPLASTLMPNLDVPVLRAPVAASSVKDPLPVSFNVTSGSAPGKYHISNVHLTPAAGTTSKPAITTARGLVSRAFSLVRASVLSTRNWIRFALVIWVLVATGLLARLALASARVLRTARRATLINDEFLRVEVERACRALGVTRWIDIAASNEITVPMVIGVARPRIVLPLAAQEWSRERMSVVLLHEIAHIRRRDCVFMLFAQVVSAVVWFHPAVIRMARDVRRESERACDDLVLATGVRGSDYAEHLVSIARLSARRDSLPGAALAFAARSTLEERVASILSARSRSVSPRAIGGAAALALALCAAIAAVHPTHAAPAPAAIVEPAYSFSYSDAKAKAHKNEFKVEVPVVAPAVTQVTVAPSTVYNFRQTESTRESLAQNTTTQYQIAGTKSDESDGESWYDRAHNYYQRGSFDKAGRAYESAARFGYEPGAAFYNAGCSYALAGQADDAIKMLGFAVGAGFDDPEKYATDDDLNSLRNDARFQQIVDQARRSDTGVENRRAAENQYQHLAAAGNVEEGNWNSAGIDLLRAGAYDQAATAFDNEYKISGDNDALYNKACARALAGKTAQALDVLEQAIAAGSVDIGHLQSDPDLTSLHSEKRFEALCELERSLSLSDSWQNDKAEWKGNQHERWVQVLPRYQGVTRVHPRIGRAWFNLGFVQLMVDQPQASSVSFQKALDLGFRNPTTLYNLACANARAGNQDMAFRFLDKAEKAGFDVANHALSDGDLDPIRADARWKALEQRWQTQEEQKNREKNKKKYD